MKKTYIIPGTKTVKIASRLRMLSGSTFTKSGDFGELSETSGNDIEVNSRSFGLWDDEE